MERFRDSVMQGLRVKPRNSGFAADTAPPPRHAAQDRSMGELIAESCKLSAEQVDNIVAYQRQHGGRFGQAAIAIGYASTDDVLHALAQQFDYPYASAEQRKLMPELVALNEPFSAQAEAIRGIRSWVMQRVFAEHADKTRRALAVVSPNAGDGKSFIAANLAITLAQLGGRTLLVDADLRGPRLHSLFGMPGNTGLSGILSGRTERRVVQKVNGIGNLYLLPVGITPPNPLELVERPAFGLLMRELSHKFDHVVVDTSAAEYGTDATVIAARCGAALVVARRHSSRVGALQELSEMLSATPANLAGVIVNEF
jgi:protein-tyrosine kinase